MTLLLAVFRSPEMLKVLLSERRSQFSLDGDGELDPYVDRILPLNQIGDDICPWRDKDVKAWRSLSKVPNMSPRAAQAIVRMLLATVLEPGVERNDPGKIAFGTSAIDLRPSLCHVSGEIQLIEATQADTGTQSELPNWHWNKRQEIAEMPELFCYYFLWRLSLASWDTVLLMLAMFDTLDLANHAPLTRALARLSAATKGNAFLWWCDAILDVPAENRVRAVEFILGCGAQELEPSNGGRQSMRDGDWQQLAKELKSLVAS